MNRPTRNTIFGAGIVLVLAVVASCHARAQPTSLDILKGEYDRCVFGAVADRHPTKVTVAEDTERAFRTCATEEQAIVVTLSLMPGNNPAQTMVAVTTHKLLLKRTARESVKN